MGFITKELSGEGSVGQRRKKGKDIEGGRGSKYITYRYMKTAKSYPLKTKNGGEGEIRGI
jgi:hypothetical protein